MSKTYIAHLKVNLIPLLMTLLAGRLEKIEPGKAPTIEETTKIWDAFSKSEKALEEEN